jgi:7-methyl-GTP pyrophosphatase
VRKLILASSSPFRRQLLARLALEFESVTPDIDESPLPEEAPQQLARRLARTKAETVAMQYPGALIIGSDQIATINSVLIGKPRNHDTAVEQLRRASGHTVDFHTAVCVLNSVTDTLQLDVISVAVKFRQLDDETISRYLQREKPYACSGSFKSEGLGIALLDSIHGDDPTALVGLPLICLTRMLELEGVRVL